MKLPFLGGLTAQHFIREYWQKKPLLIRGAFHGFGDMLTPGGIVGLACSVDAQSRLVLHARGKWKQEQGPFDEARLADLPDKGWSLLVQGVNHFLPEADALLHRFDFIPRTWLDDLMVSLASDGGGVGPHFDLHGVFLLQGLGRSLWRVSRQPDMETVPNSRLRIVKDFHTDEEWLLEPGDMLYLPPQQAHWGSAVGECMTWSVGFRAPSAQELATQFLAYMQHQIHLEGVYAGPDLQPQRHPAQIGGQMLRRVREVLQGVRWNSDDIARLIGTYLTEPKAHIVFDAPRRVAPDKFRARLQRDGIQLDLRSQMLFYGDFVFINGEHVQEAGDTLQCLTALADHRAIPAGLGLPAPAVAQLHQWYGAGYLRF